MDYELVNVLRPNTDNWKIQKARAIKNGSTLITLAPDPSFFRKKETEYANAINIIDVVTKRTYDENSSLFFDKVRTVDGAEIFMNKGGLISIIKNGEEIGKLRYYSGTRRLVQDVTYFNRDGSKDYIEEYAFDGKKYSNIFYFRNQVQQIEFFDDQENVPLRFYFYGGAINFITIENPNTHMVEKKYDSMAEFMADQVSQIVEINDRVGISYMGIELDALSKTESKNTLYLDESAYESGVMKGNLQMIIDNQIQYVNRVEVSEEDYQKMLGQNVDIKKILKRA